MNKLQKFYESPEFIKLNNAIKNNEDILIIAKKQNKKLENFYYALWFKYYDKIEIFKYLFLNIESKTSIRGKTNQDLSEFKQIVFALEKNLDQKTSIVKHLMERKTFDIDNFNNVPYLVNCPEKLISIENSFYNQNLQHDTKGDLLIFDTETNGLPFIKDYRCIKYDYKRENSDENCYTHCRLLSIGWVLVDRNTFKIKSSGYHLVKNSQIKNSINAQMVNNISDEEREKKGITFTEIYAELKNVLQNCGYIVCHGTDFDINVLCNEILQHSLSFDILKNKCICNTKQNLFKQFGQHLSDLVSITDEGQPHNALYDAKLCKALFEVRVK